ncbi:MAG: hypothetical protein J6Q48_05880 [Bacteroidaceae bacterium]|nr:hypothetical protein [Bacteroidaceae bacterium]
MAELSREDFFARISARVDGDSSPEAIAFMEDMTDTYNGLVKRASTGADEWQKKYEENDRAWSERYKARFFRGDAASPAPDCATEEDEYNPESVTVESLFSDRKEG